MKQIFHIFQINEDDSARISALPDEPHEHDYEELIIGIAGKLDHYIDFKNSVVNSPLVSFVAKGKIHRVIPLLKEDKCNMWVIRFKSEFIPETTFQLYAYYHDYANIELPANNCYSRMVQLCEIMHDAMQQEDPDMGVVRHLLSALFAMIEAERTKIETEQDGKNKTQNETFKSFLKILEENYKRSEGVDFYSEKLFMSSRNLNLICKNILNRSVSEMIETRKLIEAKNQLIHTDKTVAEIGFDLGFNEKSYFSNVFKKKSGQTPTEFREEMRKHIS